jgi:hypothetical protein
MSDYNKKVWVNGVDYTNQTNLNHIEDGIAAVPGVYFLASPYLLENNTTLNSGSTITKTCTGGSTGVPTGAKAVYLVVQFTPSGAGCQPTFVPQGTTWVAGKYPSIGSPASGQPIADTFFCPLNTSNGQIDVKGNVANLTGLYIGILGYVN